MIRDELIGFIEGVGWAAAELVRQHDQPSMAADIINASGFNKSDFKCLDGHDRKVINKLFREERVLRVKGRPRMTALANGGSNAE